MRGMLDLLAPIQRSLRRIPNQTARRQRTSALRGKDGRHMLMLLLMCLVLVSRIGDLDWMSTGRSHTRRIEDFAAVGRGLPYCVCAWWW